MPRIDSAAVPEAAANLPIVRPRLKLSADIPQTPENLKKIAGINTEIDEVCLTGMFTNYYERFSLTGDELATQQGWNNFNQFHKDTSFLIKKINDPEVDINLDSLLDEKSQPGSTLPEWIDPKMVRSEPFEASTPDFEDINGVASLLAHDIRTPLTSIKGFGDLLVSHIASNSSLANEETNKKIAVITQQMRILAAVQGSLELIFHDGRVEPFSARRVTQDFLYNSFDAHLGMVKQRLDDNGIGVKVTQFQTDNETNQPSHMVVDRDKIGRAFLNCLVNILDEKTKKGVDVNNVDFRVIDNGRFIDAFIMDDGDGFPENFVNTQTNTGTPQVGVTTKAEQDGTGVGLAESTRLLNKINCEVTIHNGSKRPLPEGLKPDEVLKGGIVRIRIPKI